jgi:hypothetical protein
MIPLHLSLFLHLHHTSTLSYHLHIYHC